MAPDHAAAKGECAFARPPGIGSATQMERMSGRMHIFVQESALLAHGLLAAPRLHSGCSCRQPARRPARPAVAPFPARRPRHLRAIHAVLRALLSGAVLAGWSGRPAARRDSRRASVIAPSAQSSRCQTLPLRQGSSRCAAGTGPVRRTSPGCETGGGRDVRRLAGPTCGQAPSKLILVSGLRIEGAGEIQNAVLQC